MTNEEILKKAIEKASKDGFELSSAGMTKVKVGCPCGRCRQSERFYFEFEESIEQDGVKHGWGWTIHPSEILFSHDFAKAFWGEEMVKTGLGVVCWEGQTKPNDVNGPAEYDRHYEEAVTPAWQHHLTKMVLEKEPLKYLEKFLES